MGEVLVSYSQLCIFDSSLDKPFNDWDGNKANQGFSWRHKSIGLRTLNESGKCKVEFTDETLFEDIELEKYERAFALPFTVPPTGEIEVGSISEGVALVVSRKANLVVAGFLRMAGEECCDIFLCEVAFPMASILKADEALSPPEVLDLHATSA